MITKNEYRRERSLKIREDRIRVRQMDHDLMINAHIQERAAQENMARFFPVENEWLEKNKIVKKEVLKTLKEEMIKAKPFIATDIRRVNDISAYPLQIDVDVNPIMVLHTARTPKQHENYVKLLNEYRRPPAARLHHCTPLGYPEVGFSSSISIDHNTMSQYMINDSVIEYNAKEESEVKTNAPKTDTTVQLQQTLDHIIEKTKPRRNNLRDLYKDDDDMGHGFDCPSRPLPKLMTFTNTVQITHHDNILKRPHSSAGKIYSQSSITSTLKPDDSNNYIDSYDKIRRPATSDSTRAVNANSKLPFRRLSNLRKSSPYLNKEKRLEMIKSMRDELMSTSAESSLMSLSQSDSKVLLPREVSLAEGGALVRGCLRLPSALNFSDFDPENTIKSSIEGKALGTSRMDEKNLNEKRKLSFYFT
jgi:hypothetical protein